MKLRLWLSLGLAGVLLALVLGLLALLAPSTVRADGQTFIVNSPLDTSDASPGDCSCRTSGNVCTLRAAIQEANACSGAQTIRFSEPWYITPTTALPAITGDGTVIDGSDRWLSHGGYEYPGVSLDGNGGAFSGLVITASRCAVYGLGIVRFGHHGVYLHGGAQRNAIGGLGTRQRNVISLNGRNGVLIDGATTMTNTVAGNYIGTNPAGVAGSWGGITDWGNGWHGVNVWHGEFNEIPRNLIADNGWSGVAVDDADRSTEIRNNRIGLSVDGQPLGNGFYGIHIANGARPVVISNTIAFNRRGIHIEGGAQPVISENTIYSNTASTLATPRGGGVLVTGGSTGATLDSNQILSNTAHFGGGIAVEGAWVDLYGNTIRANRAYTSGGLVAGGGGILVAGATGTMEYNRILSNTVAGASQVEGGGVLLINSVSTVSSNEIRGNRVEGDDKGGGGGISIWGGENLVARNTVVGNASYTPGHRGSAIKVRNEPAHMGTLIDANWIADNLPVGGAVYIEGSGYVTLTNNVMARNMGSGLYLSATNHIVAYNNTIARNGESGIYLRDASLKLDNTIVASNTHYGLYVTGTWSITQWRNNVWGNGLGASNRVIPFYLETDPLFFGADQYALRAGSPCIDVGNARVSTSFNGLTRPQGAGHDIGAYEMAAPVYLPLVLRNY